MRRISVFLLLATLLLGGCRGKAVPADEAAWSVRTPVENGWMYDGAGKIVLNAYASSDAATTLPLRLALVPDTCLMTGRDTCFVTEKKVRLPGGGKEKRVPFTLPKLSPGFYQVNLTGAEPFNIGVSPEEIVSEPDARPDFDAFWEETLQELAEVPLTPVLTPLEEHSNAVRTLYRVEVPSYGGGVMGGYLAVPVAEGKYPAFIDYMGYGAEPYIYGADDRPDAIQFLVSVRDQGIFKEGNERWIDRGLDAKEHFYYRGAYCDAVRAVDFIASLDKTDPARIFAAGDSQAGALTWIAASLSDKLAAVAPSVPFMSDFPDYWKIVWWPVWEVFEAAEAEGISREDVLTLLSYFDTKNFTARITCPVEMAFGLQDPTCPPHTNFAAYNQVRSPKSWFCVPTCGHDMWRQPEWSEEKERFFARF